MWCLQHLHRSYLRHKIVILVDTLDDTDDDEITSASRRSWDMEFIVVTRGRLCRGACGPSLLTTTLRVCSGRGVASGRSPRQCASNSEHVTQPPASPVYHIPWKQRKEIVVEWAPPINLFRFLFAAH